MKTQLQSKTKAISLRDRMLIVSVTIINILAIAAIASIGTNPETYTTVGYLGVFAANILNSAAIFSPIPAFMVTFIASSSLDGLTLVLISALATTIGETTAYYLGDGIDTLVKEYNWHKRLRRLFNKSPFLFLVIWIALPNPIQTLGQIFAGSSGYPFYKYALATFVGNALWFIVIIMFGQLVFSL